MLVELHLLTSHPPANLNRDDLGRPKEATFGGVRRARISSQSLKRAIRLSPYLADVLNHRLSTRSTRLMEQIADEVVEDIGVERSDAVREAANTFVEVLGTRDGKKGRELWTSQAVFLTQGEYERVTGYIRAVALGEEEMPKKQKSENKAKKLKRLREIAERVGLDRNPGDGVDLALFGRMTTDEANSFAAVDASMQVAHPISTHEVVAETDWFTAVDEVTAAQGGRGSAHLNETEFNSAVFYKYFSCNLEGLSENLGNNRTSALDALTAVYDAACRVGPSGKQNSFASHALADTALLVLRDVRVPVSLANAFERPVRAERDGEARGYLAESRERLARHYADLVDAYGLADRALLFSADPHARKHLGGLLPDGVAVTGKLADLPAFLKEHAASGDEA